MNTIEPLVSVLMTAYNRQKFIAEAIDSVLNCGYSNFELIIVDDCSKDDTLKIATSYTAVDPRVKVFRNEINLGDYPNRNRAISLASGEYCVFCDSDDTLLQGSISAIIDIVRNRPDFNFAFAWPKKNEVQSLSSEEAIYKHFFEQQFLFIGPGGTFMRRSFVNNIGGYPEKYGPANDMYFNLKVACTSAILLFPFNLQFYREHEGQEIKNGYSYLYNSFRYLDDAIKELPIPLSTNKIKWLRRKNYRRFSFNLYRFGVKTHSLRKAIEVWKKANFNFKYFLLGIFHLD